MSFQSPSKLIWPNSWVAQIVGQWIPDCRTSRSEGTTTKGAAADTWNSQLMAAGGSQVPAASNVGHCNAVVGEVHWCLILETPVDSHGKLVLHSLRDVEPVQLVMKQCWQTTVVLVGAGDQTCCGIQYSLQLISDRLRHRGQDWVTVVHAWWDKSVN